MIRWSVETQQLMISAVLLGFVPVDSEAGTESS